MVLMTMLGGWRFLLLDGTDGADERGHVVVHQGFEVDAGVDRAAASCTLLADGHERRAENRCDVVVVVDFVIERGVRLVQRRQHRGAVRAGAEQGDAHVAQLHRTRDGLGSGVELVDVATTVHGGLGFGGHFDREVLDLHLKTPEVKWEGWDAMSMFAARTLSCSCRANVQKRLVDFDKCLRPRANPIEGALALHIGSVADDGCSPTNPDAASDAARHRGTPSLAGLCSSEPGYRG
jgi:hypothetical protein